MRYMIYVCIVIFSILLGGCQVLNASNAPATFSAQNTAFVSESTSIPQSLAETAVALAHTAVVAETNVAGINSVNRQLIATVNAVVPATPAPQVGAAPLASNGNTQVSGATTTSLLDIGVTARKRDSDGCAECFAL